MEQTLCNSMEYIYTCITQTYASVAYAMARTIAGAGCVQKSIHNFFVSRIVVWILRVGNINTSLNGGLTGFLEACDVFLCPSQITSYLNKVDQCTQYY